MVGVGAQAANITNEDNKPARAAGNKYGTDKNRIDIQPMGRPPATRKIHYF
ncbi:hypothetical protein GCM10027565_40010 [Bordetella tumulicola]